MLVFLLPAVSHRVMYQRVQRGRRARRFPTIRKSS